MRLSVKNSSNCRLKKVRLRNIKFLTYIGYREGKRREEKIFVFNPELDCAILYIY